MAGFLSKLGASSKPQDKPEQCEERGQVMSLSKHETNSQDKRKKKKQQQQGHPTKNRARNPADDASSTDASSNASSVENGQALDKPSPGIVSRSCRHRADASVGPSVRSHKTKSTVKSYSSKRSTRSKLSAVDKGCKGGIDSNRAMPVKGRDKGRVGITNEAPLPDTRVKGDIRGNDDASVGKKGRKDKADDVREKEDKITRGSFSDDSEDDGTQGSSSLASTVDLNDEYTYYTEGQPRRQGVFQVCETAFSNCVNQIAAEVVSEVDPNHDIRSFIEAEDKGKKLGDAFVGAVTDTVYAIEDIPDKVAEAMKKREHDRLAAEKEREDAMKKAKEEESALFREVFGTDSLDPQREVIVGKDGIMVLDFTTIPQVPSDDHVVIKIDVRFH